MINTHRRQFPVWVVCLLLLGLAAPTAIAADFDSARTAYSAGDYPRAFWTFRPLAEAGDARAQYNLGVMYENGHGMTANPVKAAVWYRKAVVQQLEDAQWALGRLYANGRGAPLDEREAVRWFSRAASRGHAGAQASLGTMYQAGRGIERNYGAALAWYLKAAEQQAPAALFNLGVLYQNGHGVERDFVAAYRWYDRAAEAGLEKAQLHRDALLRHMTPAQLSSVHQQ